MLDLKNVKLVQFFPFFQVKTHKYVGVDAECIFLIKKDVEALGIFLWVDIFVINGIPVSFPAPMFRRFSFGK